MQWKYVEVRRRDWHTYLHNLNNVMSDTPAIWAAMVDKQGHARYFVLNDGEPYSLESCAFTSYMSVVNGRLQWEEAYEIWRDRTPTQRRRKKLLRHVLNCLRHSL